MKHLKFSVLILILLALFMPDTSQAQRISKKQQERNRRVYWFNINLSFKRDPKTGLPKYDVRVVSNRVLNGSLDQYDHKLWEGLGAGSRIAIGPFRYYEEAEQAMVFYSLKHETTPTDSTHKKEQVYFYNLFIGKRPRSNSYALDRRPAAVSSGTYDTFYDVLKVSLQMASAGAGGDLAKLTIGPFWDYNDAEESKRMYRLH